jgi:hypothetical protein
LSRGFDSNRGFDSHLTCAANGIGGTRVAVESQLQAMNSGLYEVGCSGQQVATNRLECFYAVGIARRCSIRCPGFDGRVARAATFLYGPQGNIISASKTI